MSWLTALGLCVAGLVAIIVEFFVPAAGIIGLLGAASIVGGIVVAYSNYGTLIGSIYLIAAIIVTPAVVALYFKLFPKSFIGRWLILGGRNTTETANPESDQAEGTVDVVVTDDGSPYAGLTGKTGTAVSPLRPAGTARIDGKKYSVVTGGEFVDTGAEIIVARTSGNRIHVRRKK